MTDGQLFHVQGGGTITIPDDVTLSARVSADLRGRYLNLSRRTGVTVSDLVRDALAAYLDDRRPRRGHARNTDPDTSKAAALDVAPRAGSQRRRALEVIAHAGAHGATADEAIAELERQARHAGHRPPAVNGVARRVTDLLQAGAIREALDELDDVTAGPRTRRTRNGAQATVYVATPKGHAWLA